MLTKETFQPLSLEALSARHKKTLGSLEKISRVTASLNDRLANLDGAQSAEKFISETLRIGLVKKALEGKAKPTLLARKGELEERIRERVEKLGTAVTQISQLTQEGHLSQTVFERAQDILKGFTLLVPEAPMVRKEIGDKAPEISERLKAFFRDHKKDTYLIRDIAQILGFPFYSDSGISIRRSRLIRETAGKLGIVVKKRGSFSREEVEKIVMEIYPIRLFAKSETRTSSVDLVIPDWITEALKDKCPLVLKGQEITIRGKRRLDALRILACTSQQRKIPNSLLAKAVYGDKIPLEVAKFRMNVILPRLRRELAKANITIVSERIDRKARYLGDHGTCYYLTTSVPQVRGKELPVSGERVESEKSQPYKLENPLICDLGKVLRAPISQPILKQFGIELDPIKMSIINQTIAELCDQSKKSQFETSGSTDEVFALLTKSLEGFANPLTRTEFLAQNSITLEKLLSSIGFGKIDTVEKLNSLMAGLHGEFLKS